ncbi:MAG TPA: RnfH family protein [Burkholderiales bacterium]|nr:RnfH family protein [Burkholderiales bacterium]
MIPPKIVVEIVYALPDRQVLRRILLPDGSTVEDAIRMSGLCAEFPAIDPTCVGIHGKPVPVTAVLRDEERVEIYRPLRADPKDVRRMRAAKKRRAKE